MKIIWCKKITPTYFVMEYERRFLWIKELVKRGICRKISSFSSDDWCFTDTLDPCEPKIVLFCEWMIREDIDYYSGRRLTITEDNGEEEHEESNSNEKIID